MHKSESCMSVDDRLVDELLQLTAYGVHAAREQLREELHGEILCRIDPEGGARSAAPGELTCAAGHPALDRIDGHADAQPEADAVERRLGEQRASEGREVDAVGKVVAGHVLDRARSEDAHAVE